MGEANWVGATILEAKTTSVPGGGVASSSPDLGLGLGVCGDGFEKQSAGRRLFGVLALKRSCQGTVMSRRNMSSGMRSSGMMFRQRAAAALAIAPQSFHPEVYISEQCLLSDFGRHVDIRHGTWTAQRFNSSELARSWGLTCRRRQGLLLRLSGIPRYQRAPRHVKRTTLRNPQPGRSHVWDVHRPNRQIG
jgi:hypothetical protein